MTTDNKLAAVVCGLIILTLVLQIIGVSPIILISIMILDFIGSIICAIRMRSILWSITSALWVFNIALNYI